MYSCVVAGRVHVGEQTVGDAEACHLRRAEFHDIEDSREVRRFELAGVDPRFDPLARRRTVAGDQRLDTLGRANPRPVMALARIGKRLQQLGREKREVAGYDDDSLARRHRQRGVDAAERARALDGVRVGRQSDIRVTLRIAPDGEDPAGHPLQDLHLTDDDGASLDNEATLVLTAEAAGASARHDGGSRRGRIVHGQIMTEGHLGRLLGASLHQAIAEVLPMRLEFYEHWLHGGGLRDGTIGMAPMSAVVGFLRTEGDAYDRIVARAGALSAEWGLSTRPALSVQTLKRLPRALRLRGALRLANGIACSASPNSPLVRRMSGAQARVQVTDSLFCTARGGHTTPRCGFYSALITRTLELCAVNAVTRLESCRAVDGSPCVVIVEMAIAVAAVEELSV